MSVKEQNFKIKFSDISGIAYEQSHPSKEEIKKTLISDIVTKIELMGLESWLNTHIDSISKLD